VAAKQVIAAVAQRIVRSHTIEYLGPAFAGDEIEVRTWVENLRRVRSLRRYKIFPQSGWQTPGQR